MPKQTADLRKRWLHIRLTEAEYGRLNQAMERSADRKMSSYARKLILGKPVRILVRDASLDSFIQELSALKKELSAIGNNFNQVVHRLNAAKVFPEARIWLPVASSHQKKLLEKADSIQKILNRMASRWYPKS